MNTGVIATRYAQALLLKTKESGRGEQVYAQIKAMLANPQELPSPLEEDIVALVALLKRNSRTEYLKYVLRSFQGMYEKDQGIVNVKLTSAVASPDLEKKLMSLIMGEHPGKVQFTTKVDPSVIGGFILEIDDRMLDASIATQIARLRREFIEKAKRIV